MIKQQQKDFQKDFSLIAGRKRSCRSICFHFSDSNKNKTTKIKSELLRFDMIINISTKGLSTCQSFIMSGPVKFTASM